MLLKAKEFEAAVVLANDGYKARKVADIGRYGISSVRLSSDPGSKVPRIVQQQSLPDFEGVIHEARQIIFDCKVRSDSSFSWKDYIDRRKAQGRQLAHMRNRAEFGVPCFFLIHWNPRVLKKSSIGHETWILPISRETKPYWDAVGAGEIKGCNREDCRSLGVEVMWGIPKRSSKVRPEYLEAASRLFHFDLREGW
jgi:penicillin-binding protein-related factor A (putative recombinase)